MQVFKRVVDVTQPEVVAALKEALAKEAAELKAEHGHAEHGHADKKAEHGHAEHGHAEGGEHGHEHEGGCCGHEMDILKIHERGGLRRCKTVRHPPRGAGAIHFSSLVQ